MRDVLVTMTKLMAPVLSFTADEIWRMLPEPACGGGHMFSVHLSPFPEINPKWFTDSELAQRWDDLLHVRSQVQAKLEEKRREKQ
jgi:isoleucyl-tRNA synthetase